MNIVVRLESCDSLEPSLGDLEEGRCASICVLLEEGQDCITAGRESPIPRQNNEREQSLPESWSPEDVVLIRIQ